MLDSNTSRGYYSRAATISFSASEGVALIREQRSIPHHIHSIMRSKADHMHYHVSQLFLIYIYPGALMSSELSYIAHSL